MSTAEIKEIREKLYAFIDKADETKVTSIYNLVQGDIIEESYINEVYKRREEHLNGKSKSYTYEEFKKIIQNYKLDV